MAATDELELLLERYWSIAYEEGKSGARHDTPDGAAQQTLDQIRSTFAKIINDAAACLPTPQPVIWPAPSQPTAEVSSYDHIIANGYRIEWKSWKDYPGYTVEREVAISDNWLGTFNSLEEAIQAAEKDMQGRIPRARAAGVEVKEVV